MKKTGKYWQLLKRNALRKTVRLSQSKKRKGIKGLILQRSGKLKSTHPASCSSRNPSSDRGFWLPQSTSCRNPRDGSFYLVDCGSWIAAATNLKLAATMHEPQCTRWNVVHLVHCSSSCALQQPQCTICGCRSSPGWVEFSLPQRRNISFFIPSQNTVHLCMYFLLTDC